MLRLWPDRPSLALFSDRAWLYAGTQLLQEVVPMDATTPFGAADALLQRMRPAQWWRTGLDLLISDEMTRAVALPWQGGLRTAAQQLRYAEACLEDSGVKSTGWTIQHGYRRYGRAGLAFAVQTDTLRQLTDLAAARRFRLRSVLPVTAAAYWRHASTGTSDSLVILAEARRISVLHIGPQGLERLDVQPVLDSTEMALCRLLRRVQLRARDIRAISCWSSDDVLSLALVRECYPGAKLAVLAHRSLG